MTETQELTGWLFLGGLAVFCWLWFGWFPVTLRPRLAAQADEQIERGDYGGCLATSATFVGVLLAIALFGVLLVVGFEVALEMAP